MLAGIAQKLMKFDGSSGRKNSDCEKATDNNVLRGARPDGSIYVNSASMLCAGCSLATCCGIDTLVIQSYSHIFPNTNKHENLSTCVKLVNKPVVSGVDPFKMDLCQSDRESSNVAWVARINVISPPRSAGDKDVPRS